MQKNIWLDGMMGLIVGDALGCPVQFFSRTEIKNRPKGPVTGMESGGVFDMPEGTWTDDSSMALATMASIIEKGEADPADIMLKFVKWELKGEYTPFGEAFDQGNTCTNAIYKFIKNPDIASCGSTGERANGNGALMRILPACLYYARSSETSDALAQSEAIHGIHVISGLTHNHLRSKICCGIYYFMAKSIIDGILKTERPGLKDLLQKGIDEGLKYYGQDIRNLTEMAYLGRLFRLDELKDTPEEKIKSSGYVIDSIEASVWCLINTDSYKDCMLKAVNLGDDADTVAAIAGGLAGLYYGYDGIPKEWLSAIKRREWIEGMCQKLSTYEDVNAKVVDLHSHMLPDIDDGAKNFEMSKQMIKLAYEEGCRHLFLTPHASCLEKRGANALEKMNAIREWIILENMNLNIYLGTEIYIDSGDDKDVDELVNKIQSGTYPTLNGTKYVLTEFRLGGFEMNNVVPALKAIIEAGYKPVIAHAERYGDNFEDLCTLKSMGCLFQINICDLYRDIENDINRMTHKLMKEKMIDFIGTDAHRMERRRPDLKEYIDFLYRNYDKEYVDGILYDNAYKCFKLGEEGKHMSTPRERIAVFEDTQNWIESDKELSDSVALAKNRTEVFFENDYPVINADTGYDTEITVTPYRSYEAAMKLSKDNPSSKIAVMNFANAFRAGGGVANGASAQEECLCRTSTLYPLIYRRSLRDSFYKYHADLNTSKASDSLIYTEGVVICKTDEDIPKRMDRKDWVSVDVITIAAPDLRQKSNIHFDLVNGGAKMNNAELLGYHVRRAIHMLTVAASKGADILVLGAFGCGAFENDPNVVAKAYRIAISQFPTNFKKIEFAVYCPPGNSTNYDVFSKMMPNKPDRLFE